VFDLLYNNETIKSEYSFNLHLAGAATAADNLYLLKSF